MDVTVMVRSEVLRAFDRQMADLIKQDLIQRSVKFLEKSELVSIAEEFKDVKIKEKTTFLFWFHRTATKTIKERHLRVKWKKTTEVRLLKNTLNSLVNKLEK